MMFLWIYRYIYIIYDYTIILRYYIYRYGDLSPVPPQYMDKTLRYFLQLSSPYNKWLC